MPGHRIVAGQRCNCLGPRNRVPAHLGRIFGDAILNTDWFFLPLFFRRVRLKRFRTATLREESKMGVTKINTWDLVGAYPVCGACGSRDIRRDAWAEWNMATRGWELRSIFDDFLCEACGLTEPPNWTVDDAFRQKRIRRLNDAFRRGDCLHGTKVVTAGIKALGEEIIRQLVVALAEFDAFTEANDPHGEHDFGKLELGDQKAIWKIDAFDLNLKWASPDAANPQVTHRVLTLMLAAEY